MLTKFGAVEKKLTSLIFLFFVRGGGISLASHPAFNFLILTSIVDMIKFRQVAIFGATSFLIKISSNFHHLKRFPILKRRLEKRT